jgi:hypothetical protein
MPLIGLDKVEKAIDNIVLEENKRVKAIYTKYLSAIITMTPVHFKDGGRLRNNWFLTTGKPSASSSRKAEGEAATGSHNSVSKMPEFVMDKTIYFTNNLPYANVVEYGGYPKNPKKGTNTSLTKGKPTYQFLSINGYSAQRPNGMVRINLVKMRNKL